MAELTNSDFMLFSQVPSINSARANRTPPLPNLLKNGSLAKGEISPPASGEDLYAHNFLNLVDWKIAFDFLDSRYSGSDTYRYPIYFSNPNFTDINFPSISSLIAGVNFFWSPSSSDPGNYYWPLIVKSRIPDLMQFQGSEAAYANEYSGYLSKLEGYPGPSTISVTKNPSGDLLASDFHGAFEMFSSNVDCIKNGCTQRTSYSPSVSSWNTVSFSSTPPDWFTPTTPGGRGPYRKIYRNDDIESGEEYSYSQSSMPVYAQEDHTIVNIAYIANDGTILKTAKDALGFIPIVKVYQKVFRESSTNVVDQKIAFKKVSMSEIGSLYMPQNEPSKVCYRIDPPSLLSVVSGIDSTLAISLDNYISNPQNYNIWLETYVDIMFFSYVATA